MAPLYRYLAHPTEGVMNALGEGTSQQPHSSGFHTIRRTSSNMLATRRPSLSVTLTWDEALYEKLAKANEEELETIKKEEDEAVEKAGETEVQSAKGKRAEFLTRVGDKVCESQIEEVAGKLTYFRRTKQSQHSKSSLKKRVS
jgi:26S proteasome regulatory subunit N7